MITVGERCTKAPDGGEQPAREQFETERQGSKVRSLRWVELASEREGAWEALAQTYAGPARGLYQDRRQEDVARVDEEKDCPARCWRTGLLEDSVSYILRTTASTHSSLTAVDTPPLLFITKQLSSSRSHPLDCAH